MKTSPKNPVVRGSIPKQLSSETEKFVLCGPAYCWQPVIPYLYRPADPAIFAD